MRRLLGLLGDAGEPSTTPRPSLARLDDLVTNARISGLDVELSVQGSLEQIPPVVDLSAYRIVQEALTNAIRHGGRCHADLTVRREPDHLDLEITTNQTLDADWTPISSGRGLIGMRERVQLLGGTLDAGPSGEGFRVRATLPIKDSP